MTRQTWKTTGRNDRVSDSKCRNCGRQVDGDFARVFGDTANRVYACKGCEDFCQINDGAAARPSTIATDGGREQ